MAAADDIRTRVRNNLLGAYPKDRPFQTLVTEAMTDVETDMDVTDGADWSEGDIAESVETGEQLLVTVGGASPLTVTRGFGQIAGGAISINTLLNKNPRFSQDQIDDAVQSVLDTLGSHGIHAFGTGSETLVAGRWYYEQSETDIDETYGILGCYYPELITDIPQALPFVVAGQLDTTEAVWSSSHGIKLLSKGNLATTGTFYFTYAKTIAATTDLLVPQEEVVVLGATVALMGMTIAPATQDPGSRTDRTTPPGQTTRDGRWFQGEFFRAVKAEAARIAVVRQQLPGDARSKRARRWRS